MLALISHSLLLMSPVKLALVHYADSTIVCLADEEFKMPISLLDRWRNMLDTNDHLHTSSFVSVDDSDAIRVYLLYLTLL